MLGSDTELLEAARPSGEPVVTLLPALDPYLMGYKDRRRYLGGAHDDRVFDRSGNATSTILVDGVVVGVWDFWDADGPELAVMMFEDAGASILDHVIASARSMGRFIAEGEVGVTRCPSMVPLTERTAGSFMSPLQRCSG